MSRHVRLFMCVRITATRSVHPFIHVRYYKFLKLFPISSFIHVFVNVSLELPLSLSLSRSLPILSSLSHQCDWLLSERKESPDLLDEGLDPNSPVYKAILANPSVQLGLNSQRCFFGEEL